MDVDLARAENAKRNIFNEKPDLSPAAMWIYAKTRLTTLIDIPIKKSDYTVWQTLNPIPALKQVNRLQWNLYFLGFFGWTVDSMDFFLVSVTASHIAETLDVSIKDITWGITLVLMFRSLGAAIFGILIDYYGRKWPYIFILCTFVAIEIGTGFVQTYAQFLGIRAVYGVMMGGLYSASSVLALEDLPTRSRSILSGLFLPGYNLGYILAAVFNRAFQDTYKEGEGWRSLFWFSGGVPIILIVWRLFYPETQTYLKIKEQKRIYAQQEAEKNPNANWFQRNLDKSIWVTIKTEWLLFIYLILLMSGLNFSSHGSQDLFPTLLEKQYTRSSDAITVIMVVCNLGAIVGGIFFGQLTELLGRRLTLIICFVLAGAFTYPSFLSQDLPTLTGFYFFLMAFVMGSWGIAPLHLFELVNASHRSFLSGLVYQLGNLTSSASSTIEATLGEKFPLQNAAGEASYNYGKVMAIFCGAVFIYMIVVIFIGPERFHRDISMSSETNSIVQVRSDNESDSENSVAGKEKVNFVENKA